MVYSCIAMSMCIFKDIHVTKIKHYRAEILGIYAL